MPVSKKRLTKDKKPVKRTKIHRPAAEAAEAAAPARRHLGRSAIVGAGVVVGVAGALACWALPSLRPAAPLMLLAPLGASAYAFTRKRS